MDKYEYNLKLEEIDRLVDQGDYEEAAKLADTIDWKRVRNVRTLCLISEIYEASGRLEDSKSILVRVYRRTPVGRTVLYRLVEVTTALQQYDEAIEYYTEYVQAAPHDNNRYILKYKIYKGRGSSVEELISILEEYLGQEYTERWAYELATLYQQSGQMQKCFAACDDLVLWFHSGKYVMKALELKKRYTVLTPKQQQIYEECMEEQLRSDQEEQEPEQEETVIRHVESTDGEVIAESIMAETEKEIAGQVMAHKAELDKASDGDAAGEDASDIGRTREYVRPKETDAAGPEDLQAELAKSMRKIISGVVKHSEETEEDIPASVDPDMPRVPRVEVPEQHGRTAGQISIDDVLLSMGDKGRKIVDTVLGENETEAAPADAAVTGNSAADAEEPAAPQEVSETEDAVRAGDSAALQEPSGTDDAAKIGASAAPQEVSETEDAAKTGASAAPQETPETEDAAKTGRPSASAAQQAGKPGGQSRNRVSRSGLSNIAEAAAEDLTETQREALQYTSNPEKLLRNKSSLPTYFEEPEQEDLGRTRRIGDSREELMEAVRQDILSEKTIRIPTEEISGRIEAALPPEARRSMNAAEELQPETSESAGQNGVQDLAAGPEDAAEGPAEAVPGEFSERSDGAQPYEDSQEEPSGDAGEYEDEYLTIPQYLRGLFNGFTEVEGLEDQIANAILQAEAKGADRTSRNGNILIFGAHGSGKTTLAMALAKAIAQDRGSQVMKIARIYAADLNRKDIAATIARIAGGTLIVEEAGDLEPDTVEQLTTAMEFRTDGLIMILEDEQQYIHEMLMRHPRFTMKFTAQIYLPEYTVEELAVFGRIHANAQDYVIGQEAYDVFCGMIAAGNPDGSAMTIADVAAIVDRAIARSGKFFRKITMGKKRYDENDYVILFPKDFK